MFCVVLVTHSWYIIEPGTNDKVYLDASNDTEDLSLRPNCNYATTLESEQYTGTDLALELSRMTATLTGTPSAGGLIATYKAATQPRSIPTTHNDMTVAVSSSDHIAAKRST